MDLLMSHNFEIELQESHACPHDKEGDKPLMGLTKNTNTGINEGAEGNMGYDWMTIKRYRVFLKENWRVATNVYLRKTLGKPKR